MLDPIPEVPEPTTYEQLRGQPWGWKLAAILSGQHLHRNDAYVVRKEVHAGDGGACEVARGVGGNHGAHGDLRAERAAPLGDVR